LPPISLAKHLPPAAILPSTTPVADILTSIAQARHAVDSDDVPTARLTADRRLREQLLTLAEPQRSQMLQILDDFIAAI